jgi:pyruvate decarboxylase
VSTLPFTSLVGPECTLAFAERVPIIHIVGTPPTEQMKAKPLLHHTLGNGHFEAYSKAAEHFVVASAILSKPSTAGMEIDMVLVDCIAKVAQPSDISRGRFKPHPL